MSNDTIIHAFLELAAGIVAFFAGFVIVSRARKPSLQWIVPLGSLYITVGFMDVAHAIGSTPLVSYTAMTERFIPWTWGFSRLFLLVGFAWSFYLIGKTRERSIGIARWIPAIFTSLGLAVVGICSSLYIPPVVFTTFPFRPFDLLLFPGYVYLTWKYRSVSFILFCALILDCLAQMGMVFSPHLYDFGFVFAHIMKLLAYAFVLIWLEAERPINQKSPA